MIPGFAQNNDPIPQNKKHLISGNRIYRIENQKSIGLEFGNLSDWNWKIYRIGVAKSVGLWYAFRIRGDAHGQDHGKGEIYPPYY